jgi:hypothetical protein
VVRGKEIAWAGNEASMVGKVIVTEMVVAGEVSSGQNL